MWTDPPWECVKRVRRERILRFSSFQCLSAEISSLPWIWTPFHDGFSGACQEMLSDNLIVQQIGNPSRDASTEVCDDSEFHREWNGST